MSFTRNPPFICLTISPFTAIIGNYKNPPITDEIRWSFDIRYFVISLYMNTKREKSFSLLQPGAFVKGGNWLLKS